MEKKIIFNCRFTKLDLNQFFGRNLCICEGYYSFGATELTFFLVLMTFVGVAVAVAGLASFINISQFLLKLSLAQGKITNIQVKLIKAL